MMAVEISYNFEAFFNSINLIVHLVINDIVSVLRQKYTNSAFR